MITRKIKFKEKICQNTQIFAKISKKSALNHKIGKNYAICLKSPNQQKILMLESVT